MRDLLQYRDSLGTRHPVGSVKNWRVRREDIRAGVESVMGPLPSPPAGTPLEVQERDSVQCAGYRRVELSFQPEPGDRVPAYLLVPDSASASEPAPGVLCLHQTQNALGNREIVGLGGDTELAYAAELATAGFVCLAPAYPTLADYQVDWRALGYQSCSMKGIWNHVRGLDLLDALDYVRGGSFGAIGHSLGGHNSIFAGFFDPRVVVVATSCGFDSFLHYGDGDIAAWGGERYMPRILDYRDDPSRVPFDFHELIAGMAPRHLFISAPLQDDNFGWRSVAQIAREARRVYSLFGYPERLHLHHPDCGHSFPAGLRQAAYQLIGDVLANPAEG